MKKVCLLGASGNIGKQSLDIFRKDKLSFELVAISIGHQANQVDNIVKDFPSIRDICLLEEVKAKEYQIKYPSIRFYYGDKGILDLLDKTDASLVENALVGFAGLFPSIHALTLNKTLCLANKESLVVGGAFIRKLLHEGKGKIFPIDSEHVAIAKCLRVADRKEISKILITGSGGAFRDYERASLKNVTSADALRHPTWSMGPKITIDSDTMFNKGFEVIEASVLYDWPIDDIAIILHKESHLHSAILLKDGTYIGEVNPPDMHGPIAYALYEGNVSFEDMKHVSSLEEFGPYSFKTFDEKRYPAVGIALAAYKKGVASRTILNAAVEECDYLFLKDKISFLEIEEYVQKALDALAVKEDISLEEIKELDHKTREYIRSLA